MMISSFWPMYDVMNRFQGVVIGERCPGLCAKGKVYHLTIND